MTAILALVRREVLEHRGAFLYAPGILLSVVFLTILLGASFGQPAFTGPVPHVLPDRVMSAAIMAIFAAWSTYLLIALVFYFADSFSADRRNNSLLFWKSMPQSDLKILTSKVLTALTAFPLMIILYALASGILAYILLNVVSARLPFIQVPGILEAFGIWAQFAIVGTVYLLLSILWFAPFFGWVAALSTLFQRWSIPLAFLIPGVVVIIERLTSLGNSDAARPIAGYLGHRFEGIAEDIEAFELALDTQGYTPFNLLGELLPTISWIDMSTGIAFAALMIYLASEYRRRLTSA